MTYSEKSPQGEQRRDADLSAESAAALVHPHQLEVQDWPTYSMVIDARSPHEYADDHIPGAINLPVVDDGEYAEVGTTHKTDKHSAYLIGVEYSLRNIASHIRPLISRFGPRDRFLVYCFRGGKRSRLWADNLRTIGFEVDLLAGGWKNYRRWVRAGLESLPRMLNYRVLCGPTGCGKTRVLHELRRQGQQVVDLEGLASHRGSLLGELPGSTQPSQKWFDSQLLDVLRHFDTRRVVWLEAESKRIGNVQLPEVLFQSMHRSPVLNLSVPMAQRVRLWREDYPHLVADPQGMVEKLTPLKALVGGDVLGRWQQMAKDGVVDGLFQSVMTDHYDVCYERSSRGHYGARLDEARVDLESLDASSLAASVRSLVERFGS
jgi:tRNA 2-selenouridine synthase